MVGPLLLITLLVGANLLLAGTFALIALAAD